MLDRYPIHLEDESDSDAELFMPEEIGIGRLDVVKTPGNSKSGCATDKDQPPGGQQRSPSDTASILERSVIKPGYEQLEAVPKGGSRAMQKKQARLERATSTGGDWFNMKAPEMTEEVKQNLEVLQMRSAINKKRVYKKNDMRVLPKYFAMGTVVEHAADFYSSRIPRKQRRKTLVEELMADVDAKKQLKKAAAKLAVKKQLKAQNPFSKKKKPFKKRRRGQDD